MQMIRRDLIRPNDWNVNAFDPELYPKLVESIRHKGLLEPLKVMPDPTFAKATGGKPDREGHFLLVDGYHRWKSAQELGIAELPCEVWDISLEEAKIRGLQLNYLRGAPVPDRLAGLVHDLNRTLSVDDLATMLPWSVDQLRDSLELLQLPADLRERVEEAAAQQAASAPIPVTVVLLPPDHEAFEEAVAKAKETLGKGANRGQLWGYICRCYLDRIFPDSQPPVTKPATAEVGPVSCLISSQSSEREA